MQEHFSTEVPSDVDPIPDDPGEGLRLAPAEVKDHSPSAEPRFGYRDCMPLHKYPDRVHDRYDKNGHYEGWVWHPKGVTFGSAQYYEGMHGRVDRSDDGGWTWRKVN
jgi:hypothetical protein